MNSNPIPWTIEDILRATKGVLLSGDPLAVVLGIGIDSRSISSGLAYLSICGKNLDGHDFIQSAIEKNCSAIILDRSHMDSISMNRKELPWIAVEDTTKALGDLARFQRARSKARVVAITGSNGKTSTKDLTASLLGNQYPTLATKGNLNNEIGLPLTLLNLSRMHEFAVVELGMNHPGEIARLADICRPDLGVITNIGPAHLEGVGSIEGVMNAKAELLPKISPQGAAVLNGDDPMTPRLVEKAQSKVVLFGAGKDSMVRAISPTFVENGYRFALEIPSGSAEVKLSTPADYMVSNALAAAAAGFFFGLGIHEIKEGLEAFHPAGARMNLIKTRIGINIIDDTYNANPESVKKGLMVLQKLREGRRGIAVLGDMFELGEHSEAMHREIGVFAAESGLARLYATGDFSMKLAEGAVKSMDRKNILAGSKKEIIEDLLNFAEKGDWILIKGSRAMEMETIADALIEVWKR